MNDMASVIKPKSDQLNSDDLISGPITVELDHVVIREKGEQRIDVHYVGDNGKPWRPCKSMCRVLVHLWGRDANAYKGKKVTLYRESSVTWGGAEVGGIRISHASGLSAPVTMSLTAAKTSRKPFTVKPLEVVPDEKARLLAIVEAAHNAMGRPQEARAAYEEMLLRGEKPNTMKKLRALAEAIEKDAAAHEAEQPRQAALIPDDTDKRGGAL